MNRRHLFALVTGLFAVGASKAHACAACAEREQILEKRRQFRWEYHQDERAKIYAVIDTAIKRAT